MNQDILGYNEKELLDLGAYYTASEINQQPDTWRKIWHLINNQKESLKTFLDNAYKDIDGIVLTGAGTSAFIGLSLEGAFNKATSKKTQSISTTHLVSHPNDYFSKDSNILMVSFARSGNSPESVASVKLANQFTKKCYHLIITCNTEGELAMMDKSDLVYQILLPEETNDKSLAMTSSYSGMLLSGLLAAKINKIDEQKEQVEIAAKYGEKIISNYDQIKTIAAQDFKRAVFLGSGPLYGTAQESHLKLQELTDGATICKHDSYLGFRHGPKAVIDESTLIVFLLSNSDYVSKYESDLVQTMDQGKKALIKVGLIENKTKDLDLDILIDLNDKSLLSEEFTPVCFIIMPQLLGFYKSIHCGLSPDSPSKSGAISRVVQGVTIYEK